MVTAAPRALRRPRVEPEPTPRAVEPNGDAERRLTPAAVLAAQRSAGNQAVARLLQGGHQVQRAVHSSFRGQPRAIKDQKTLNEKVQAWWQQYGLIDESAFPGFKEIAPDLTDAAIEQYTREFLTDNRDRSVQEVAIHVFAQVRERPERRRVVNEGSNVLPGIRAAVLGATAVTDGLHASTQLPAAHVDFHAPKITFKAVVGVDGSEEALAGWEVGITQTVLHVSRRYVMRVVDAAGATRVVVSDVNLAQPMNDRNAGSRAPWYNEFSPLDAGRAIHAVALMDKPGDDLDFKDRRVIAVNRNGTDRFGTWVILWHPATQRARFLGGWTWNVDYGHEAGTRTQVSGFTSRLGTGEDPPEAVLSGERCGTVLTPVDIERPFTVTDAPMFDAAAASDRTRQEFSHASAALTAALRGADTTTMGTERDRAIAAWRNLPPEQRPLRQGELLAQLREYELRVHHRGPSEDALRDEYGLR